MERMSHFDLPGFLQSVVLEDMNLSGKMVHGEDGRGENVALRHPRIPAVRHLSGRRRGGGTHLEECVLFDLPGFLQSVVLEDMTLSGKMVHGEDGRGETVAL